MKKFLLTFCLATGLSYSQDTIQDITITASATEVCAGESVDLSVNLNLPTICDMQINLTDIPQGQEIPGFTYGGFYNEHYYYVHNDPTSWTDGEQICRENGGYLVCINDESENTFVSNLTNNNIWIGLFRDPETCEFRWLDCIDINFTNWRPGEPNSGPCGEPYTQIIRGCSFGYNTWNNLGNNSSNGACYSNMVPIMEIDPEIYQTFDPSTTYLWSTGDTTETISVTPTETTEYWVDVTTNGVTFREYAIISVQEITINASATEICDGESVDLTVLDHFQEVGSVQIFIDGILSNTSSDLNFNNLDHDDPMFFGVENPYVNLPSGPQYLNGTLDDVAIWNRALSPTEVLELYNNQAVCNLDDLSSNLSSGVVGYWPFCNDANDVGNFNLGGTNYGGNLVNDRFGNQNEAYFLGTNEWIEVAHNDALNLSQGSYSLSAWVKKDIPGPTGPAGEIHHFITKTSVSQQPSYSTKGFCLRYENSKAVFFETQHPLGGSFIENFIVYSSQDINPNDWHLITGVYYGPSNINQSSSFIWSTGDTNETISVTPTETTEYWVDVTTNGVTCREYITIDVTAPEAPISGGDITECETTVAQNLVATASANAGESITWYDAATGGNVVANPSLGIAGTVTFFAEAINDNSGCASLTRIAVTLTIEAAPEAPVSGGDITECETITAQSLVATASANAGESITWYDAATGGSIVANPSLSAAGTVTYYAEAINDTSGCLSLTRTAVTLTITSVAAPTGDAVQSFCDNVTVSDLSAVGSNIQWYDADTGGNGLDPSSSLANEQVLYASQTQNGCESLNRLEVNVEIDIIPDPILINTELEFCLAREETLADLEIDDQGFALELYDSFSGGNMLPMDTLLEDGVSYYATLYDAVSGCESLVRLEVVPTVIPCEVIIYNALSLNGNGQNDYMVIENAEYFPDNSLEVYNRDGHLIYSQTQYGLDDNLFRGVANVGNIYGGGTIYNSSSGSNLPTGSYLYVFKYFNPYEQQQYTLKGFLTINSN